MTSRDFIQAEAENTDRIVLYREGLFWKAYERSAFAVCSQIRPFKPTKRSLKTLGGGELVSIGFPTRTEDTVLAGLERLSAGPERLELRAASPIDVAQFEAWKASVSLALPRTKERSLPTASSFPAPFPGTADPASSLVPPPGGRAVDGAAPAQRECVPVAGSSAGTLLGSGFRSSLLEGMDFTLTAACRVADALMGFDLASKTPVECMLLVSELKRILMEKK